jgi:formimidoylglutamate deiminase
VSIVFAEHALLPSGWASGIQVELENGSIAAVTVAESQPSGGERVEILLPGLPNLHSHAFQRGMAGLAETRGPAEDNFWTWREAMYRFALRMNPQQAEAVAAQAYCEMLESGFTRVGEFHYLHHAPDGQPYENPAEMADRVVAAAAETGIALTLLPVFYAHSTFGGLPPAPGQRRFICGLDGFARLLDASRSALEGLPRAARGAAPHSLRAVTPEELAAVARLVPDGPLHIHAAEQAKEVADCVAWSGARPVEWLLDHAGLDRRWCVIHATHMNEGETRNLAASGAVAGLCPVTEANLGDGTFPASAYAGAGGAWGVGTDSNVLVSASAELRQLEYAQRLREKERNVLADTGASTGRTLFAFAHAGGCRALGAADGGIAPGMPADFVSLTLDGMPLADSRPDTALDGWIFAATSAVDCVWVDGTKVVQDGLHLKREDIRKRFRRAMRELLA